MYEAKSGVISNSPYQLGRGGGPKKVDQNDVKHILVLKFLRSDDFLEVHGKKKFHKTTYRHTYRRHSDQISRSALEKRRD